MFYIVCLIHMYFSALQMKSKRQETFTVVAFYRNLIFAFKIANYIDVNEKSDCLRIFTSDKYSISNEKIRCVLHQNTIVYMSELCKCSNVWMFYNDFC